MRYGAYTIPLKPKAIEDLFTDDYVVSTGACGTALNPGGVLVSGSKYIELKTNRTLVVTLVSSSQLEVKGFGKYQSNARVLSSYGLTGTLAKSDPDQTGPNCCSLGSGVYSLADYWPGLNRSSLQSWARSRFIANGLQTVPGINVNNMTGQWGYRGGGERPDCALVIVQGRNDGAESALSTTISEGYLEIRGTAVWLFKQPTQQPWQFDLVDVNGRVVHSFNGDYTDAVLLDLQQTNVPSGLYFGQLRDKTGVKNIRLTKSN